jgi:signal transduction histidine kinase
MLDDIGVIATIGWFCRNFHISFPNIMIRQTIDMDEDQIPEHLKIVIFRILQEALNNIAKYSRATLVVIGLTRKDGPLELNIKDNGADNRKAAGRLFAAVCAMASFKDARRDGFIHPVFVASL